MNTLPNGIFTYDQDVSYRDLLQFKAELENVVRGNSNGPFVIPSWAKFQQFGGQCPDAFCRYCASPNLTSSAWCTQCGAQMMDGDR